MHPIAGLNPDVHNIVKGRRSDISRVVGNRVYLKVIFDLFILM